MAKNKNVLNGMVIDLDNNKIPLKDKKFTVNIPKEIKKVSHSILLLDPDGDELAKKLLELLKPKKPEIPPELNTIKDFKIPDFMRSGEDEMIPGMFDGDIPKLRFVPLNFSEKSPGTVKAPVFDVRFCNGSARKIHKNRIPETHPRPIQIAAMPCE